MVFILEKFANTWDFRSLKTSPQKGTDFPHDKLEKYGMFFLTPHLGLVGPKLVSYNSEANLFALHPTSKKTDSVAKKILYVFCWIPGVLLGRILLSLSETYNDYLKYIPSLLEDKKGSTPSLNAAKNRTICTIFANYSQPVKTTTPSSSTVPAPTSIPPTTLAETPLEEASPSAEVCPPKIIEEKVTLVKRLLLEVYEENSSKPKKGQQEAFPALADNPFYLMHVHDKASKAVRNNTTLTLEIEIKTQLLAVFTSLENKIGRAQFNQEKHHPHYKGILYVGSEADAAISQIIKTEGITHIINTAGSNSARMNWDPKIGYSFYEVQDVGSDLPLDAAADEIHFLLQEGKNVLIHCVEGRSRSAAVAMGFCIKYISTEFITEKATGRNARSCFTSKSLRFTSYGAYEDIFGRPYRFSDKAFTSQIENFAKECKPV